MEPTVAPPPPAVTTSSPRHRRTNSSSEDPTAAGGGPTKLRLMCSYGGHIVPRPHDKSLCYVGGDTRIVVVDRHTTLSDLTNRLVRSSNTTSFPFTLKYQLPSEDLDSLISVTTDEDLENMIDEYDRNSNRLRLFLFPVQPDSGSSIGPLLQKSEDWFLSALNGTTSSGFTFSDTSSVNCLLGLEDDVAVSEKKVLIGKNVRGNNNNNMMFVQDVQSVPDSPLMETTSSFGSASSLGNLPPIRVTVDDQKQNQLQQQYQQKPSIGFDMNSPDSVSSDGSLSNPLSRRKPSVGYQDPVVQTQVSSNPSNINDINTRIQNQQPQQQVQVQVQDSGYVISSPTTQVDPQHNPKLQPQPHPQFIHTAVPPPQYLNHHPSGVVPMASYYQTYPSQSQIRAPHPALDQHNIVYYMPVRQPPQSYTLPLQADPAASAPPSNQVPPPSTLFTAPRAVQPVNKTEPTPGVYRTGTSSGPLPPQLVQVPSSQHPIQPQFVGYSHIQPPSQPTASGGSGNYVYEFTDPSQKQHIYYAAQPLPPQSAAQYQTITSTLPTLPVEAQAGSHLQASDSSMKQQQVRTSQP